MNLLKNSSPPLWEQPESRRLEFKEDFPKGDQIAKTVVAFANGAGGKIVLGVRNNPRQIAGIPSDALFPLEEQITNHIADSCSPTIVPEVYIQAVEGKNLLVVEIFPGSHKPEISRNRNGFSRSGLGLSSTVQKTATGKHSIRAKQGPSWNQVGTKSGPSRDQVGIKSGLSRD